MDPTGQIESFRKTVLSNFGEHAKNQTGRTSKILTISAFLNDSLMSSKKIAFKTVDVGYTNSDVDPRKRHSFGFD